MISVKKLSLRWYYYSVKICILKDVLTAGILNTKYGNSKRKSVSYCSKSVPRGHCSNYTAFCPFRRWNHPNRILLGFPVVWRTPGLAGACRCRIIILLMVSATALELSGGCFTPINEKIGQDWIMVSVSIWRK